MVEIKAPQFPESVADGTVATWHKSIGDRVKQDELLVDIETDKVVIEVVAPADGVVTQIFKKTGDIIKSLELLGTLESIDATVAAPSVAPKKEAAQTSKDSVITTDKATSPAARRLMDEKQLNPAQVEGSGKGGRVTKEDVVNHVDAGQAAQSAAPIGQSFSPAVHKSRSDVYADREERRVPMTRLRARVAERLMDAKQNTAMLTTFNEVNMKPVMEMRKNYKDAFEKAHGTKLGFMSFFVRASVEALKKFPEVNASIDGNDIVYHSFYDIGVAVSSDRGLVVPVIRNADRKSFAEVEQQVIAYGEKARAGKLTVDDLTGGTFTISNGGVFGSLLSTPILNPPQTAIIGLHKIQERPVAVNGQVVILPMMYLALSYDHRLIDGRDAVQFLVAIKELIEDPARLLLEI